MNKIIKALVVIGLFAVSNPATSATFTLDFDTAATGSNIVADGFLNTPLGLITLFEETPGDACIACFGTFPNDLPFSTFGNGLVEAGSTGVIGLDFGFEVAELTFNFGGDGGNFAASVLDIGGSVLDSFFVADLPGSGLAPGPLTFTALGIRSLRFDDPRAGAAIDNLIITASAVPLPAAFWLFGTAFVGMVGFSKRRKAI